MFYITNYIDYVFNSYKIPKEIDNNNLDISCKEWINLHFIDNKIFNFFFKNLSRKDLYEINNYCNNLVAKQVNKNKTIIYYKLSYYLFLIPDYSIYEL